MNSFLDVAAVVVCGVMVGNEFALAAFVHPAISKLEDHAHLAAAKSIAGLLGRVMPFWYGLGFAALLIDLWIRRSQPECFLLLTVGSFPWGAMIVFTITALVPLNNRIAEADLNHPYSEWRRDRAQWDARHRIRVTILLIALLLSWLAFFSLQRSWPAPSVLNCPRPAIPD